MQNKIDILFNAGFFSSLDYFFAATLLETAQETNQIVALTAALVSKRSQEGHLCLDITQMAGEPLLLSDYSFDSSDSDRDKGLPMLKLPAKSLWIKALRESVIVGKDCTFPLVLDSDNKLYLAKFFDYQRRVVKNITQRINYQLQDIDNSALEVELNKHFDNFESYPVEEKSGLLTQKKAVKKAIKNNFLIVSGGPGTGKTYITDKIAKVFKTLYKKDTPVKIINTAPTGKAASKLQEGLTIHRLLKINTNNNLNKKQDKHDIVADIVVIDEASMIDIALMTRLLEAISLNSKVIIIGDKNQLGSIESGSVFSDICKSELLDNFIVNLDFNFRSSGKKGITKLAKAINTGDQQKIESLLTGSESKNYNDLTFVNINNPSEIKSKLKNIIIKGYTPFLNEENPKYAYQKLDNFRVLCSHRRNFFGSNRLNIIIETILQESQFHDIKQSFLKSVLMITKNDYNKLLFNGDMGMVAEIEGKKKALFLDTDLSLQSFNLSELNTFENAFAITVHKSQGSEFDHVLFILPSVSSNMLTRELLYTAITRAKKKVTIAGNIDVIKEAVKTHSKKESGITKLLDETSFG
jgi:exodeoxyribonuclease V alpha subunit